MHRVKYLARVNPILAAIFPLIFLYAQNIDEVPFVTAAAVIAPVLAAAFIFMAVAWLIMRDDARSGLLAVAWLLLFFSYGHILELIAGASIGGFVIGRVRYLLAAELIVALLAVIIVLRSRLFSHRLTPYITVVLLIPIVFNGFSIGLYHLGGSSTPSERAGDLRGIALPTIQRDQLPDIYYIILDSYPREDVLRSIYGFDNSQFLENLEENGFYIASDSLTNYMETSLSLSSSLNLGYLQEIAGRLEADSTDVSVIRDLVQENAAVSLAKRMGYRFAFLHSPWRITKFKTDADDQLSMQIKYPLGGFGRVVFPTFLGSEFGVFFTRTTLLRNAVDVGFVYLAADLFNNKIEQLKRISEEESPTFTFAHFFPPHPPYLFDREGNVRSVIFALQSFEDRQSYIEQLIWVNKSIAGAVDYILENKKRNSVIVIQGDHGTAFTDTRNVLPKGGDPDDTLIHERSSILNVYHLPEMCKPGNLYKSISPVNTFRMIFDSCWGTELGLLEDKSYWSSYDRPFDFTLIEEVARHKTDP